MKTVRKKTPTLMSVYSGNVTENIELKKNKQISNKTLYLK